MKYVIAVTIVTLTVPIVLFAQINWTEHTINGNLDGAFSVHALDIDGDGDVDVVGAAFFAGDIIWCENLNGSGSSWEEHPIDTLFGSARSVYALDLDGDSDIDVLAAGGLSITWWENDGNESFSAHTITGDFNGAFSVYAVDLDDDSDIDILGAAMTADDITWFENDGNENFTEHTIDGDFDGAISVSAVDLDDDNDIDILGTATNADDITWFENDGDENFTPHPITEDFDGAFSVSAVDLDDDNDIDILGTARIADDITWFENDGNENFTPHIITGDFDGVQSVFAIDMDNDNDIDVLGAAGIATGEDIVWFENDGDENFTPHPITEDFDGASSVYAIDIDGDDDIDVLGAAQIADAITLWRSDLLDIWDVKPVSVDIDSPIPEGTELYPQATVTNLGTNAESFIVTCEIDPGDYMRNRSVQNLAPGDSVQVTFLQLFTFEPGTYTVTVYTRLTDDENFANDTLVKVIETYVPGVTEGYEEVPEGFSFSAPTISKNETKIKLALPTATRVDLVVYDVLGRVSEKIVSERLPAGYHNLPVNLNLPAGIYFYNLKTGTGENIIKKFLIIE